MIYLNGKQILPTIFPDRTSQVWKIDEDYWKNQTAEVWWWYENEAEIFQLLQLNYLLNSQKYMPFTTLKIPYLPYARQDKAVDNQQTFALHCLSEIFERCMYWHQISIFDAHSDVFFKNSRLHIQNLMPNLSFATNYKFVIFPDQGAATRYSHLLPSETIAITADKQRDPTTGYITDFKLNVGSLRFYCNDRVLVVDDLCDGGATFKILAKSLPPLDTKPDLYVSHGIFSKGVDILLSDYAKIITTNSFDGDVDVDIAAKQHTRWRVRKQRMKEGRLIVNKVQEIL